MEFDLQEMAEKLRKEKAKGVKLNSFMEKIIADAEAEAKLNSELARRTSGRGKLIAALYILGGSLHQMARRFEIKVGTVWTYVRNNVPEEVRRLASRQRDFGRSGQLLGGEQMERYIAYFEQHKASAMLGKNSVGIAAALNAIEPATKPVPESLDDADGEPY